MSSHAFFEAGRDRFFRPLNSARRELVAACLRTLYERLHGPSADYAHNLNRDELKELLMPVVQMHQERLDTVDGQDELNAAETDDPNHLASLLVRVLVQDGWLEQYPDRQGLVTAFRFSRPGKLFAEAFWALHRPSRSLKSKWEPEFEEYLDFFNAVYRMTESADALDLFGDNELSTKHLEIRDRLVKLLLDNDQERATRELLRIADYRNYRRYDIFNESDSGGRIRLSERGTGSGGQLAACRTFRFDCKIA